MLHLNSQTYTYTQHIFFYRLEIQDGTATIENPLYSGEDTGIALKTIHPR